MKQKKVHILALSWRDIQSPNAGGAEINTHELLKTLDTKQYEVIHISPRYKGLKTYEVVDGITYLRHGNIISVILYAIRYYRSHKNNIDFVIDQCNTHRFFTSFWVEESKRIFLIYQLTRDIWDIKLKFPFNKMGKALENSALRLNRRDRTITESESTKRDLLNVGFTSENIFVIPIIMKITPWKPEHFLPKMPIPQFVYVGRYAQYKGIDTAIKAVGQLKKDKMQSRLVVLGKRDVSYMEKVLLPICNKYRLKAILPERCNFTWISENAEDADVIFAGFVSEEDKLQILSSSWALVFPSNREGWGIPISEAAYVGTPSIVYDSQGLCDAVDYGRAGYLCPEKTAESICGQMRRCINDQKEYEQIRQAAYKFSANYLGQNTEKLLERVLKVGKSK